MRLLVVYCHPVPTSYNAAILATATAALVRAGHEFRVLDLYEEGFDPVLTRQQREEYLTAPEANVERVRGHVDALLWAEGLVFIFPTWMYGPPALLKGWLDRTWLPGVAFEVPKAKGQRPGPKLLHIRRLVVITTSGSPWWWLRLMGDPVRALFKWGLRATMAKGCRVSWFQLYSMNNTTDLDRRRFLERVDRGLSSLPA